MLDTVLNTPMEKSCLNKIFPVYCNSLYNIFLVKLMMDEVLQARTVAGFLHQECVTLIGNDGDHMNITVPYSLRPY